MALVATTSSQPSTSPRTSITSRHSDRPYSKMLIENIPPVQMVPYGYSGSANSADPLVRQPMLISTLIAAMGFRLRSFSSLHSIFIATRSSPRTPRIFTAAHDGPMKRRSQLWTRQSKHASTSAPGMMRKPIRSNTSDTQARNMSSHSADPVRQGRRSCHSNAARVGRERSDLRYQRGDWTKPLVTESPQATSASASLQSKNTARDSTSCRGAHRYRSARYRRTKHCRILCRSGKESAQDEHWIKSATSLVTGLILHLMLCRATEESLCHADGTLNSLTPLLSDLTRPTDIRRNCLSTGQRCPRNFPKS